MGSVSSIKGKAAKRTGKKRHEGPKGNYTKSVPGGKKREPSPRQEGGL